MILIKLTLKYNKFKYCVRNIKQPLVISKGFRASTFIGHLGASPRRSTRLLGKFPLTWIEFCGAAWMPHRSFRSAPRLPPAPVARRAGKSLARKPLPAPGWGAEREKNEAASATPGMCNPNSRSPTGGGGRGKTQNVTYTIDNHVPQGISIPTIRL